MSGLIKTKGQLYTEERTPTDGEVFEIAEKRAPLTKIQIVLLNLTYLGLNVMFLVLTVEVVPTQLQSMVGSGAKGRWLGGMVAAGSVLTFLTGPLVGMWSDRLVSRFGQRRPIMVVATGILCAGLFGMAFSAPRVAVQRPENITDCNVDLEARRCSPYRNHSSLPIMLHNEKSQLSHPGVLSPERSRTSWDVQDTFNGNIGLFITFYLLVTTSFVCVAVPYNALIADKSHPDQRGLNSGMMGFMILFGNITGAAVGLFFLDMGVLGAYSCVVVLLLACVLITVFSTPESPSKPVFEPVGWKTIFLGFWEPLKEHNFRWVFFTRFLMQQGVSTVVGFLEYWLSDMVTLPLCWSPQRSVAMMLLPLLGTAAISSVLCGIVSDRLARRKPLVIISAMMMCVVTAVLAFIRGQHAFYIAVALAFVFGAGFGAFVAVDFALVMDVLPQEKEKAKDIAVWHQAMVLPQALATPIGGVLLDVFESVNCHIGLGYIILFLITTMYFFCSGLFVLKIRGVR